MVTFPTNRYKMCTVLKYGHLVEGAPIAKNQRDHIGCNKWKPILLMVSDIRRPTRTTGAWKLLSCHYLRRLFCVKTTSYEPRWFLGSRISGCHQSKLHPKKNKGNQPIRESTWIWKAKTMPGCHTAPTFVWWKHRKMAQQKTKKAPADFLSSIWVKWGEIKG